MPDVISRSAQACVHLFSLLINFLQSDNNFSELDLKAFQVQDELDRFQVWAGNTGAIQGSSSRASLDYRLQDAPFVSDRILEFLRDLSGDLSDSKDTKRIWLTIVVIFISLRYCFRQTRESSSVSGR